jgi:hypothetical protein
MEMVNTESLTMVDIAELTSDVTAANELLAVLVGEPGNLLNRYDARLKLGCGEHAKLALGPYGRVELTVGAYGVIETFDSLKEAVAWLKDSSVM